MIVPQYQWLLRGKMYVIIKMVITYFFNFMPFFICPYKFFIIRRRKQPSNRTFKKSQKRKTNINTGEAMSKKKSKGSPNCEQWEECEGLIHDQDPIHLIGPIQMAPSPWPLGKGRKKKEKKKNPDGSLLPRPTPCGSRILVSSWRFTFAFKRPSYFLQDSIMSTTPPFFLFLPLHPVKVHSILDLYPSKSGPESSSKPR